MMTEIKTIKCLTIKQPFAGFIMKGFKDKEIRNSNINHRGLIAIHSSKVPDVEFIKQWGFDVNKFRNGNILGIAKITGTSRNIDDKWFWMIEPVMEFKKPIPYSGNLGLWDLNVEVIEKEVIGISLNFLNNITNPNQLSTNLKPVEIAE